MKTQGSLVDSAMAVVGWLLCVAQATAQMPLADPQLELRGPSGQTAIVAVRYFDGLQAVETQVSRSELSPKTEAERLAFGHAGIYIKALVATSQPVKLRLLDGEREVASVVSNQPGSVELRYGQVPADDMLELPRGLPDDSEKTSNNPMVGGHSQSRYSATGFGLGSCEHRLADFRCLLRGPHPRTRPT